jgi:hypothetical protein
MYVVEFSLKSFKMKHSQFNIQHSKFQDTEFIEVLLFQPFSKIGSRRRTGHDFFFDACQLN